MIHMLPIFFLAGNESADREDFSFGIWSDTKCYFLCDGMSSVLVRFGPFCSGDLNRSFWKNAILASVAVGSLP